MKHKFVILLAAFLCAGALAPTSQASVGVSIHIGDRPYYTRGPWYVHSGVRYYWVPGHWAWRHHHRTWVHGYYAPRTGYYAPYRYYHRYY